MQSVPILLSEQLLMPSMDHQTPNQFLDTWVFAAKTFGGGFELQWLMLSFIIFNRCILLANIHLFSPADKVIPLSRVSSQPDTVLLQICIIRLTSPKCKVLKCGHVVTSFYLQFVNSRSDPSSQLKVPSARISLRPIQAPAVSLSIPFI